MMKVSEREKEKIGRVRIGARVAPETLAFLESLGRINIGRAIDASVQLIRESGMKVQAGSMKHPGLPRRVF
jgi:hypothetical protein